MKLSGEQQTEATQIAARMTERDERKVRKEYNRRGEHRAAPRSGSRSAQEHRYALADAL